MIILSLTSLVYTYVHNSRKALLFQGMKSTEVFHQLEKLLEFLVTKVTLVLSWTVPTFHVLVKIEF